MHTAHHLSPFIIIYGFFYSILPLDLATSRLLSNPILAISDFVLLRQSRFDAMKLSLTKSNELMARYANADCRDVLLNVGNLVYVPTENVPLVCYLSCKIDPRWVGPFPNSSIISSVAYCVELPAQYVRMHPVIHVSYLRPHMGPTPPYPLGSLLFYEFAAGEYKVTDILDSKILLSSMEYLIKWVGYTVYKSSLERTKHLANAPNILN